MLTDNSVRRIATRGTNHLIEPAAEIKLAPQQASGRAMDQLPHTKQLCCKSPMLMVRWYKRLTQSETLTTQNVDVDIQERTQMNGHCV